VQEATLLHRAAGLLEMGSGTRDAEGNTTQTAVAVATDDVVVVAMAVGAAAWRSGRGWRREVGDLFGDGVLGADGAGVDAVALASLGHGIVTAVKVLALLEVLGEVVGTAGQLAVEPEEALLFRRERLEKTVLAK
jgi:hypothetical protein